MSVSATAGEAKRRAVWTSVGWLLFAIWVTAGLLVMARVKAGFLTSHAADLTIPAWLYIVQRTGRHTAKLSAARLLAGAPPIVIALVLFLASTATEVSQKFWPHGMFPGTFDPLDIVAYAIGVGVCFAADRAWPIPAAQRSNASAATA